MMLSLPPTPARMDMVAWSLASVEPSSGELERPCHFCELHVLGWKSSSTKPMDVTISQLVKLHFRISHDARYTYVRYY
jgi:hypothetical protein